MITNINTDTITVKTPYTLQGKHIHYIGSKQESLLVPNDEEWKIIHCHIQNWHLITKTPLFLCTPVSIIGFGANFSTNLNCAFINSPAPPHPGFSPASTMKKCLKTQFYHPYITGNQILEKNTAAETPLIGKFDCDIDKMIFLIWNCTLQYDTMISLKKLYYDTNLKLNNSINQMVSTVPYFHQVEPTKPMCHLLVPTAIYNLYIKAY